MSFQWKRNLKEVVRVPEFPEDSLADQLVYLLRQDTRSTVDLLVLYESMKQQILESVDNHWVIPLANSQMGNSEKMELLLLEQELLLSYEPDPELHGILLMLLAVVNFQMGNLVKAKYLALVSRIEAKDTSFIDLFLALCSIELDEAEEARDRCVLALHDPVSVEHPVTTGQTWRVYAYVLSKMGHQEQSFAALRMADELFSKHGFTVFQVKVLLAISNLLAEQQDWYGGVFYLKKAVTVCYQSSLQSLEIEVLRRLEHFLQKTGQSVEAVACKMRLNRLVNGL